MNILILTGSSQYNVLNHFCNEIYTSLIEMGENVDMIDALTTDFSSSDNSSYNIIFSFNRILTPDYKKYTTNKNVLEWAFLVDHPVNHLSRLKLESSNLHLSCIDKSHTDFSNKYFDFINYCDFIPHGGSFPSIEPLSFYDKKYDVVFFGSYKKSSEILTNITESLAPIRPIVNEVINIMSSNYTLEYDVVVLNTLKKYIPNIDNNLYVEILNNLSIIESFLRAKKREEVISKLIENGITVDVFGNGFESFESCFSNNLRIHPSIEYTEVLNTMAQSKISLNVLPLFTEGAHERIFSSMLCRSICVSDSNKYLNEHFTNKENILLFDLNDIDSLPSLVLDVLNNENKWNAITENAYNIASTNHTWKNRAEDIVKYAKEVLEEDTSTNTLISENISVSTKISVIIPCYNSGKYINKCLDSIVNQTIGINNLEIICINDASTDNTLEILCQYEQKYPESFLVINNEVNTKQGYARNLALQYSSGEYITFVDSDDYIACNMLEKLYLSIEDTDYDYTSCNFYRVVNGINYEVSEIANDPLDYIINSVEKRKAYIIDENDNLGCWGTLYKKTFIIENNLYFAEGIVYEDLPFMGLKKLYVNSFKVIPERLYYYVDYNDSSIVTKKNSTHHFDRLKAMENYLIECRKRDLYDIYHEEIEMHFIWIYYINSLTLFASRFDQVPAKVLINMISTIKRECPNYKSNKYIKKSDGIIETLFNIIDINPQNQAAWDEIMNILKDI